MVQNCPECTQLSRQRKEPLLGTPLPEFPWKVVGTDLFELEKKHYLLIVDYFARYPEVIQMKSTTSTAVIDALKAVYSRHGIPEIVRSDNGLQYASGEYAKFASTYGFKHITSSPHYPQSNGQGERCVQTVKRLLVQSSDPYLSLMSYRATPLLWSGFNPAELLMGRKIRTTISLTTKQLTPQWSYLAGFRRLDGTHKDQQKKDFDREHRVHDLPEIPDDTEVWVTSDAGQIPGRIVTAAETPRSYVVETPTGEVRRNCSQLRVQPETPTAGEETPAVGKINPHHLNRHKTPLK